MSHFAGLSGLPTPPVIKTAVTVTLQMALIVCFISAKFSLRKTTIKLRGSVVYA
jgi:hypothetical protein